MNEVVKWVVGGLGLLSREVMLDDSARLSRNIYPSSCKNYFYLMDETEHIRARLSKVGIVVEDVYDLVNTSVPYSEAIPVLADLLKKGVKDPGTKSGIIRALAVKYAKGQVNDLLIEEYDRTPVNDDGLRWVIGNTMGVLMQEDDIDPVLRIVSDANNGTSRQMFVMALWKFKSSKVESVLIELLSQDGVISHALYALGRMRSQNARAKVVELTTHQNTLIRREAILALKRIDK